jgi:acyl carrier protein
MESHQEILNQVQDIIADIVGTDKATIKPESTLDSLGADSLDQLEIIMKIEEKFGIEIDDEQAQKIKTLDQAIQVIELLQKNK